MQNETGGGAPGSGTSGGTGTGTEDKKWLTLSEAARVAGIAPSSLVDWVRSKKVISHSLSEAKKLRITRASTLKGYYRLIDPVSLEKAIKQRNTVKALTKLKQASKTGNPDSPDPICKQCGNSYPATAEYWSTVRYKLQRTGGITETLRRQCVKCRAAKMSRYNHNRRRANQLSSYYQSVLGSALTPEAALKKTKGKLSYQLIIVTVDYATVEQLQEALRFYTLIAGQKVRITTLGNSKLKLVFSGFTVAGLSDLLKNREDIQYWYPVEVQPGQDN